MYKNKKTLALIPARGGSKGLPGKNIKQLLGKPLIGWTIEQALTSKYLDKVIVSTDDEAIASIAREYGAEVPFLRPAELAQDESPTMDAIYHAIDTFEGAGENYDYLALLEPTSPLRGPEDIDKAIAKLVDNREIADSLISLGEIALEHPAISKRIDENGYATAFCDIKSSVTRRQDLEKAYFPYGVIYLATVDSLRELGSFYQSKTLSFFIERWQNYEADDAYDFICIEAILKNQNIGLEE